MVAALMALAQPGVICAQTYYFNAPVAGPQNTGSGYQEIPFADINSPSYNGGAFYSGVSASLSFGMASGTLLYNPVAATLQLIGNVAVGNSTFNGAFSSSFSDTQMVNGVAVPAEVSLNYTVGNIHNGEFSFNTGVLQHINGSATSWQMNLPIPISGSYSLVTGGQSYGGAFGYTLNLVTMFNVQSATSTSMTFYQDGLNEGQFLDVSLGQTNTANGMQFNLHARDHSDDSTRQSWHLDGTQAVVPEPTSLAILAGGFVGLALCYRHRKNHR